MLSLRFAFLLIIFCSCSGKAQEAARLSGKVIGVKDGDTIELLKDDNTTEAIRLFGIDCPEKKQPFGMAAKSATSALCFGKQVSVVCQPKRDRYKRLVGVVYVGRVNVNEQLLRGGWAWHYTQYDKNPAWDVLQDGARRQRVGLWADADALPPWEWRRAQRINRKSHNQLR